MSQRVFVINVIVGVVSQVKHFGEFLTLDFSKVAFLSSVKVVGLLKFNLEVGIGLGVIVLLFI